MARTAFHYLRVVRGKTTQEVAETLGIALVTYSRIENGHVMPKYTFVREFAKALGYDINTVSYFINYCEEHLDGEVIDFLCNSVERSIKEKIADA